MKKAALTYAFLFFASIMVAQVNPQEKQILVDLYNATDGAHWNNTWNLNEPVETWHGITTENNAVTGINLLFNNLNGKLPASLGNLKNLKKLELSFNSISGEIPSELGNLKNLEVLAINGTDLSGSIPASLGNLSKLTQLHLSSNKLTGSVPQSLENLKNVEVFNVFDNDLFGSLPTGLIASENLKQLIVAENGFVNQDDFSVILLSNSGSSINLDENSLQFVPASSIIAVERDESED